MKSKNRTNIWMTTILAFVAAGLLFTSTATAKPKPKMVSTQTTESVSWHNGRRVVTTRTETVTWRGGKRVTTLVTEAVAYRRGQRMMTTTTVVTTRRHGRVLNRVRTVDVMPLRRSHPRFATYDRYVRLGKSHGHKRVAKPRVVKRTVTVTPKRNSLRTVRQEKAPVKVTKTRVSRPARGARVASSNRQNRQR